jgi:hypothetical protein
MKPESEPKLTTIHPPLLASVRGRRLMRVIGSVLPCVTISSCQIPLPPSERLPPVDKFLTPADQFMSPPEDSQLANQRKSAYDTYNNLPAGSVQKPTLLPKAVVDVGGSKPGILPRPSNSPTVQMLIEHVTCELYRAAADHIYPQWGSDGNLRKLTSINAQSESAKLWAHLMEDNFVAAIDMTLTVTHTEGLNPSLGFITPLYSATMSTFNRTASIGGQLGLTQDQDFDVNYVVDMGKLLADPGTAIRCSLPAGATGVTSDADDFDGAADRKVRAKNGFALGLEGDLGLGDVIANGLVTVEATKDYNLYGTSGPKYAADASTEAIQQGASAPVPGSAGNMANSSNGQGAGTRNDYSELFNQLIVGPKKGGATSKVSGGGGLSPTISFSSTIDFDLVWGLNGGYNWTLIHFKGPVGGGGGGGGAGGGSSGSSAGGGGSSSLVSFSRTTLDTLAVTFTPTCRNDTVSLGLWMPYLDPRRPQIGKALADPTDPMKASIFETPPNTPAEAAMTITELDLSSVSLPAAPGPFQIRQPSLGAAVEGGDTAHGKGKTPGENKTNRQAMSPHIIFSESKSGLQQNIGGVTWSSGYVGPNADFLTLQGTVTGVNPSAGSSPISLEGRAAEIENGKPKIYTWKVTLSTDIGQYFETEPKTTDYWQSIAGCSTITAGDQKAAVSGAQSQNLLVRLFRTNTP